VDGRDPGNKEVRVQRMKRGIWNTQEKCKYIWEALDLCFSSLPLLVSVIDDVNKMNGMNDTKYM
jgi:hypothetical protein